MSIEELILEIYDCLDRLQNGDMTFSDMGDYFFSSLGEDIINVLEEK